MIRQIYFKELSQALRYLPAWMPNSILDLGDIVDRNTLERQGNIKTLLKRKISFTTRLASTVASFEYSSAGGVAITAKVIGKIVAGSSLAKIDAGLIVKFSKENAIVFIASGCTSTSIDDINSVGKAIVALSKVGDWNADWAIVTEVVRAGCATIIVSGGKAAQIDLKATAKVTPADLRLADPSARLAVKDYRDVAFKFIAETGLTPLYRANGIRRGLLGGRHLSTVLRGPGTPHQRRSEELSSGEFIEFSADDFFMRTD